ncbi:hypothetical protein BDQ12DRAFT_673449 [Crucibulum laeve]|uniref:Yippee domain-containing protein n=1 Tax=Crucibulum laeve TaxID=68775 RepID=A0A5C3ML99_9AGAR|nr:hypothetical protein BDQ12DRAFT_673449 [Crucibulum laeve]
MSNYDYPSSTRPTSLPRRLPPVPSTSKRTSRPRALPQIPRALACKQCQTCITSNNVIFPSSAIPPGSRTFKGFSGKALLFTETYNVNFSRPRVQLMATGAHTMQEINCGGCAVYLGWKIVRAHEETEKWKEGNCLLELENLYTLPELHRRSLGASSDTDSDISS